jgi:hypothetical protein
MSFSIPYVFVPGAKALAQQVNSNFAACKNAIIENQDKIGLNISDITNLQTNKANKNGAETETFVVADATEAFHSVNKQQFDDYKSNLESTLYKDLYVPYSVASGKQDTDGFANFILKNSNSQITILAGGSSPNLIICYPDGVIEQISVDTVIGSGLTADNKYFIVKEKGSSITIKTQSITEDIKQPQSPNTGDYWLNIGIRPYKPFKYDGSIWIETQFVKLGEVTKTNGTLGIPLSYAFNTDCSIFFETTNYQANTVYRTLKNIIINAADSGGGAGTATTLCVGTTSNPVTVRASEYTQSYGSSITSVVRAGEYWRVTTQTGSAIIKTYNI